MKHNKQVKIKEHFSAKLATVTGPGGTFFIQFQFCSGMFAIVDSELRSNAALYVKYQEALDQAACRAR